MTAAELEIVIQADVNSAVANINKVDKSLKKVNDTAQKSGKDFTGLSRVIQDLPFGFQGIQNNLTALVPAAGAVGLAFSAIVSAITFAQVGMTYWQRSIKATKAATDEFKKSLDGAKQGAISTGQSLLAYVVIARDNTQSLSTRNEALREANQLLGDHGQKLTLVNINTQAVTEQINKFTQALIAEAVAAKYSDRIAELIIKQTEASKAYGKSVDALNKAKKDQVEADKLGVVQSEAAVGNVVAITKENLNLAKAYKASEHAAVDYKLVTKELHETSADFNATILQSVQLMGELGHRQKEIKEKKIKLFNRNDFDKDLAKIVHDPFFFSEFSIINDTIQKAIDSGPPLKIPPFDFDKTALGQRVAGLAETIRGAMEGALEGIGESIGNLLSGQKNPFSAIFSIIGDGLKAIGKQLIIVGQLGQAIQKALAVLFKTPAAAIAVGIAAIALGTVISNLANKSTKAFASGGVVTQPTLALIGEQGPERVVPLGYEGQNTQVMQGEVVFTISGQTLRGILRRADQSAYNNF